MSGAQLVVAALEAAHDRSRFACGTPALDRYLREVVTQDVRRRVAACFVMLDGDVVAGYYTLSAASVALTDLPHAIARKLPRYPAIPVVRMGRLAVDQAYRGRRLGAALLVNALQRAAKSEIAAVALTVDAKDETAAAFYRHFGFAPLTSDPLALFMPLATVK
ncbi:GNAT family N-acetyltransferase [Burkholderia cenocepacia]|uniref:GNAT family N-acetyltransferase n=1 Tax=Burkholderia cenocepacia TaxID=95486 RepID=A0A1V2VS21_9BURK|nr:GNAT family N-acetyltransferase [Burkholderia cenocepacia]MBR8247245.1 GNAT family N-acetyltransferase [Burkholderia cenocepacia]MBR8285326.1 GNAT family N-acetyltransferase [Burkholderia cenocepacia]MBR8501080.1 GNAT family N-acetyltransferase [Burkholderia cenocepacia]ONI98579.1 GNAT family N-acetyltransferase [Burkholderia cenocepacia]ONJ21157.1 GNAT family N-acetyltransferase [Burkholderia cenocepacia]